MNLPPVVAGSLAKLDPSAQKAFFRDFKRRRKSLAIAYVAWLLIGWHYLYTGRILLQFAFWFTFGGFLIWWIVDFFRVPGIVARVNEDIARELMGQYRAMA